MSPAPVGRGANFSSSSMGTVNHGASRRSSVPGGRVIGFCLTIAKRYPTVPSQGDMDVVERCGGPTTALRSGRRPPLELPLAPDRTSSFPASLLVQGLPDPTASAATHDVHRAAGAFPSGAKGAHTFVGHGVVTVAKDDNLMIDARQKVR